MSFTERIEEIGVGNVVLAVIFFGGLVGFVGAVVAWLW